MKILGYDFRFTHLFNDLPKEERARLLPYELEEQLLHFEQMKLKAEIAHKNLIREINRWQKSIINDLLKMDGEQ